MSTLKQTRDFLEQNDLLGLHVQFGKEEVDSKEDEKSLPHLDDIARDDIWSEAIKSSSGNNISAIQKTLAKVKCSDLCEDSKRWWETILSIGMNAPLEELERLCAGRPFVPQRKNSGCICEAARRISKLFADVEREVRRKKEQEERERLAKLQAEAEKRRKEKEIAEQNLGAHRRSRGDR